MKPPTPEPINACDAHTLASLLAGRSLNGEVDRVSDAFRQVARRMAGAPAEDRGRVFDGFLGLFEEAESAALIAAIAAADPEAPPPEGEAWPALRLGEIPPVPDFPLQILPDPVLRLVSEVSGAIGCDPGFVAGHALGIAAGAIGRSRSLQLGSNHFARPCLFLAVIGLAGDGKSPALAYVDRVIRDLDLEFAKAFRVDKDRYLRECKEQRKGDAPDPPAPVRLGINDCTIEALYRVLADNPRGLAMHQDELSAFLLGLNQYKSGGNDRSQVLKMWSGSSVSIDRVLNEYHEPIRIPHPTLSIVGNIPPAVLPKMIIPGVDDGFLDRWLLVCPNVRRKLRSGERRPVSREALDDWASVIRRLWGLELDLADGQAHPKVVFFTNDGFAEYNRLFDELVEEVNAPEFPKSLRGPWAKLEEYAGRLCLILTVLRHACDPTSDPEELPRADVAAARDAWALVAYFKEHHKRVRAYLEGKGLGGAPDGTDTILRWLRHHPEIDSFPESELTRNFDKFRNDRAILEDALAFLAERRAIRLQPRPEEPKGKRGRKPSPIWNVHPSLRAPEKTEIPENSRAASNSPVSPFSPAPVDGKEEGGTDGRPAI